MTNSKTESVLSKLCSQLAGLPTTRAQVGIGSFLIIDFGPDRTSSTGEIMGAFRLWIYGGEWSVRDGAQQLSTSDDPVEAMERAAQRLSETTVVVWDIDERTSTLRLNFTGTLVLTVTPGREEELEDWMLFMPDGLVLTAEAGKLEVESASSAKHLQ